jgi:hypothetical protein
MNKPFEVIKEPTVLYTPIPEYLADLGKNLGSEGIKRVVVLVETEEGDLHRYLAGKSIQKLELVGMFAMAQSKCASGDWQ